MKLGVLISGRGSNMEALARACAQSGFPAEIAVVISNVADAGGLERARDLGLPTRVVEAGAYSERNDFEMALVDGLRGAGSDVVCLAGFMRLLGADFLEAFPDRVLNIHPSLLPAFPGLHAQRQALEYGVRVAGCTVHLVTEQMDAGPILAQAVVSVRDDDDEASLSARILEQEHRLYPEAVRLLAEGGIEIDGRRVRLR